MDITVVWSLSIFLGVIWLLTVRTTAIGMSELHSVTLGVLFPVFAVIPFILLYKYQSQLDIYVVFAAMVSSLAVVVAAFVNFVTFLSLSQKQEGRITKSSTLIHLAASVFVYVMV